MLGGPLMQLRLQTQGRGFEWDGKQALGALGLAEACKPVAAPKQIVLLPF